jgi:hypothetical protein
MNLKQSLHYKEGPPQYVKVHQIFLSGGPVVYQGKKVSVKPWFMKIRPRVKNSLFAVADDL